MTIFGNITIGCLFSLLPTICVAQPAPQQQPTPEQMKQTVDAVQGLTGSKTKPPKPPTSANRKPKKKQTKDQTQPQPQPPAPPPVPTRPSVPPR